MSVIVSAEALTVATADKTLLDSVSLGIQTGDRIGVLGLNGAGKTTLLRVLAGLREADSGRVALARGAQVTYVGQQPELPAEASVRDIVLGVPTGQEHVWASDSRIRGVLDGLGMHAIGLDSPIGQLSGGERRRVSLAGALIDDSDLLILDEPTNHLDIEGIDWLARHLANRRGAVVVVTHDRWFLDTVAATTWEVADGAVYIREGGYSDWVFARAERARLAAATEERRRNLARKELAWLQHGAKARTSKPRYRVEAAEAIIADVPPPRDPTALTALATHRLGRDVLELTEASMTLPGGRRLLDRVTQLIGPGDRMAIVGPNGAGKSTLLSVLAGERDLATGRVKRGKTVRLGLLRQDPEPVDPDLRVIQALTEVAGAIELDGKSVTVSQLAERFGFSPAQQRQPVARLSGGERRRLQLLRLLAEEPNVLLLDEPTNDLDTDTLTALEDLLDTWPGTLIVVSHDRYLVDRTADTVLALPGDGTLTHRPGGVEQYLADQRAAAARNHAAGTAGGTSTAGRAAGAAAGSADDGSSPTGGSGSGPAGQDPPGPDPAGPDPAEARLLRKTLQRLDKRMASLRRKQARLDEQLADAGGDYEAAAELSSQRRDVTDALDVAETEWLDVAERLESP